MRKFLLGVVFAVFVFLSGPAGLETTAARAGEAPIVALALPTQQEERWVRDMEAMMEAAEAVGIDLRVQIARNDQMQQNAHIEGFLNDGAVVLIVAPHDAEAAAPALKKAGEKGVKVIAYDRMLEGPDVDVYLSFDNVRIGEMQGEYITSLVPKGSYVLMSGAPTDNNAALFKEGAMRFIQPLIDRGDIRVILDQAVINWQPTNARKITENALELEGGRIDAILAPNDGTASGAIAALEARGLAGKVPVTGMDAELAAAQRVVRGTQSFTIFKDTRELGKKAIEIAFLMTKGEDWTPLTGGATMKNDVKDVPSVLLSAHIVDKENVDAVLIESGYLRSEDVYNK
ncbi:MAG: substrate-binding domain-containing protein [Synergistaceae bacterium]|jgi:D-xylose transport system substrate-binding protein|nr:substrate-binding domain-containing protein [Synergistaceae bacterium]